jgi:hypothetical protein
MAPVWLFRKGDLGRVPMREASIPRLLPYVLAVLPNARPQRAARNAPCSATAVVLRSRTRAYDTGRTGGHSPDLAAPA